MSIFEILVALFLSFPEGKAIGRDVAMDNAFAAHVASWTVDPIPFAGKEGWEQRDMTAALALDFGYWEGRGKANPLGPNDHGAACGVMQPHLSGSRCAAARASLLQGYVEGIQAMRTAVLACNKGRAEVTPDQVVHGLGAYGSTGCGKWKSGALKRCREARICL